MADKKKPLPRPPRSGFGPKHRLEPHEQNAPLSADKMAAAMAAGKFEEYLSEEFKDNEQAKAMARMMMALSGMGGFGEPAVGSESKETESEVPREIADAAASGDLKGLVDLLASEHQRRSDNSDPVTDAETPADQDPTEPEGPEPATDDAYLDRDTLDQLIRIASENNMSVDWVMARAVKLYVRDYKLTGRI
jgi:hypothetical protein